MGMIINQFAFGAAPASWSTAFSTTANGSDSGWSDHTLRQFFPASSLTDLSGSQMRITVQTPTLNTLAMDKFYVGLRGTGTYDLVSKTQIFWNSGSSSFTLSAGGGGPATLVSDPVTFSYDGTHDIVFLMHGTTGGSNIFAVNNSISGPTMEYCLGDNTGSLTPTGSYFTDSTKTVIMKIEVA